MAAKKIAGKTSVRKSNPTNKKEEIPVVDESAKMREAELESENSVKPSRTVSNDENGVSNVRHAITCVCCGKAKFEDFFFKNRNSPVFAGVFNRIPVCRDCLDVLYSRFAAKYDALTASAALCAVMDLPYVEAAVHTQIEDGRLKVGSYVKMQNISSLANKTFLNTLADGEIVDTRDKLKLEVERAWNSQDRQNKKFVINKLGYDPFEAFGLEDADYRSAFNIMAKYLEDESVCEDAHKVQSIITMVVTIIQCNKVEALLTYQYRNINPDIEKVKVLTQTKKDLQATISKLAEDNNISSKYQKENKASQSHLTAKMQEMQRDEYWKAKPNMFDVRTSAAMRQLFDLSHASIVAQLELDESDYASMVKDQRDLIKVLQEKCDRLQEENRNLNNMLTDKELGNNKGD